MFRLLRLSLLVAAFLGGCRAQNWLAIDTCLDRGGQWEASTGALHGGACIGLKAK
jgi:hypothetical protein